MQHAKHLVGVHAFFVICLPLMWSILGCGEPMTPVTAGVDLGILNSDQPLCIDSDDCDDGDFCNGAETCVDGNCQTGSDPCPGQMCDEANDACVDCLEDGDCNDGDFCNGAETCQDGACLDGPDPCVDDEHCDESNDVCLECLDDNDCTGGEVCNSATNQCEPAPTLLTFQQGTADYAGTFDTYLAEQTPSTSYGSAMDIQWDSSWGSTGDEAIGLIRFDGVFGSDYDQVPVGAQITSATLTVFVFDTGDYGSMREVLIDWDESVTYGGFESAPGPQTDKYGSQIATLPGTYGVHVIDLTGSLQTWANNPADNHGWIILPSGSGGTKFRSSEYATVTDRPILTVAFATECLDDGDCDDGDFCNGAESCADGSCQAGSDPCPGQMCDEANDACVDCLEDGDCDDGDFCNGAESCADGSCQAGSNPCPGQMCDEAKDVCVDCRDDSECDDGDFCNGTENCVSGSCQPGSDPCPGQMCDEANDVCVDCRDDSDCDDGDFCNGSETCEDGTCMSGAAPCSEYEQCNDQFDVCEGIVCEGGIAPFLPPQQTGSITSGAITEASGLAASRQNPGVLWTHNDSGGGNVVYAIATTGNLLGTYAFGSGSAWDTEDIAIGPGSEPGVDYLYWGDIGDNGNVRSSIVVKRAPEPAVDPNQGPVNDMLQDVELITLQYPTGIHAPSEKDAETMFVDPINGDIYVVTKRAVPNKIYRAAYPQSTSSPTTLEWVTDMPSEFNGTPGSWNGGPTGGDVSPDGSVIVIRQYSWKTPSAALWYRPLDTDMANAFDEPYCTLQLQSDGAGEAICWDRHGQGIYMTQDEMSNPPLRFYARNSD